MLLAIIGIGPLELVIVMVIILLLFGNRLPSLMRSMGQGLVEFKKGMQGIEARTEGAKPRRSPGSAGAAKLPGPVVRPGIIGPAAPESVGGERSGKLAAARSGLG